MRKEEDSRYIKFTALCSNCLKISVLARDGWFYCPNSQCSMIRWKYNE